MSSTVAQKAKTKVPKSSFSIFRLCDTTGPNCKLSGKNPVFPVFGEYYLGVFSSIGSYKFLNTWYINCALIYNISPGRARLGVGGGVRLKTFSQAISILVGRKSNKTRIGTSFYLTFIISSLSPFSIEWLSMCNNTL